MDGSENFSDRVLNFRGIRNFRDYGGYQCSGGKLRRGLLYRSGQHRDATDEDLADLHGLGLTCVFDLRGEAERASSPCRRSPSFNTQVYFVDGDTSGIAPHIAAAQTGARRSLTTSDARSAMVEGYKKMPYRSNLRAIMKLYFETLARAAGPSLIHCMAGKDRTGLAVALLHTAMGVNRNDIIADYLLTNFDNQVRQQRGFSVRTGQLGLLGSAEDDALRVLLSVEAEYLESAFNAIVDRSGSLHKYISNDLHISQAVIEGVRQRLVA